MPHELRNIVVKELREIVRDPRLLIGMIIVPVLMMPLMGVGIRSAMEATQQELTKMETGLLNQDQTVGIHNYADTLYQLMILNNVIIRNSTDPDTDSAVNWAVQNNIATLVVLPTMFSEDIHNGTSVNVSVYQVVSHFGFGEMELAYMGEITPPSRCGRMDQGCAFGNRPVLMTFDGDRLETRELQVPHDLHFVIVDLKSEKDTM